jgi:hypothetical protein
MEKIEIAIKNIQERIADLRENEQDWSWHSSEKTRVDELLGVLEMLEELAKH